ncbi:MAG: hypothetical protein AAGI51_16000, partial [Pseudomonadota bacterium]
GPCRAGARRLFRSYLVIVAPGAVGTARPRLGNVREAAPSPVSRLGEGFCRDGDMRGFWDLGGSGSDEMASLSGEGGAFVSGAPEPRVAVGRTSLPNLDARPIPPRRLERPERCGVRSCMEIEVADRQLRLEGGRLLVDLDPRRSRVYALG